MAAANHKREEKQRRELLARLQAPAHVTVSRFEEHRQVEGYFEDRQVPDFIGSDRLLRWDTAYGTIQMGYHPRRGQPFLFANIKTSIYDTASSRDQRKMNESERFRQRKGENQNLAFSVRGKRHSSVLLYNSQNRPWSAASIRPYLARVSMEALGKTMPFLQPERELAARRQAAREDRELSAREQTLGGEAQAEVRRERVVLSARQNELSAILYRKQAKSSHFFRRINLTYDLQKQAIFTYYRNRAERPTQEADNLTAATAEDEQA